MAKLVVYFGILDEYGVSPTGFVTIAERAQYILSLQLVVDVVTMTAWAWFSDTDESIDETLNALRERTSSSSDTVYANKTIARFLREQLPEKHYQYLSPGPGSLSATPFLSRFRAKLKPFIYSGFQGMYGREGDAFGTLAEWNHYFQENASWFVFPDADEGALNIVRRLQHYHQAWHSFSGTLSTLGEMPVEEPDDESSTPQDESDRTWLGRKVPPELIDGDIRVEFALNNWDLETDTRNWLAFSPWPAVRKQFEQAKSRLDAILEAAPAGQPYSSGETALCIALNLADPHTIWRALDALETFDVKQGVGWELEEFHKFTQMPSAPDNAHIAEFLLQGRPRSSLSQWSLQTLLHQIYPPKARPILDFSQFVFMHRVWLRLEGITPASLRRDIWCTFFDQPESMLSEVLAWLQRGTALPEHYGHPDNRLAEMAEGMWKRLAGARFLAQREGEDELGWVRVDEALAWLKDIDPELLSDEGFGSITPALVLQTCAQSPARIQFKKDNSGRSPRRSELLVSQVVCQRRHAIALCRAGMSLNAYGRLSSLEYKEKKALEADTGPLERGPWFCMRNG